MSPDPGTPMGPRDASVCTDACETRPDFNGFGARAAAKAGYAPRMCGEVRPAPARPDEASSVPRSTGASRASNRVRIDGPGSYASKPSMAIAVFPSMGRVSIIAPGRTNTGSPPTEGGRPNIDCRRETATPGPIPRRRNTLGGGRGAQRCWSNRPSSSRRDGVQLSPCEPGSRIGRLRVSEIPRDTGLGFRE